MLLRPLLCAQVLALQGELLEALLLWQGWPSAPVLFLQVELCAQVLALQWELAAFAGALACTMVW